MAAKPPSLANALQRAVAAAQLEPTDQAAVVYARHLAELCDRGPSLLAEHGPKLLAALVELKLTPKARSAVMAGGGAPGVPDPARSALGILRQRAAGQD